MPTEPDSQKTLWNVAPPNQGPRPASYEATMNMEPHMRNSDPAGSFEVAERLHRIRLRAKQRLAVCHALREHQGATSRELAEFMGVDRYTPAATAQGPGRRRVGLPGPTADVPRFRGGEPDLVDRAALDR